jgi:hypothetical protein
VAIFNRVNKAAISPPEPQVKAAAAVGGYSPNSAGVNLIGQYYTYQEGELRNRAIQVPAISRARDLHASVISAMPLKMYKEVWNEETREMECIDIAPRSWLRQPDPTITYEALMSWTLDDLLMFGRCFWWISSRTQDGYPASFTRLPAASIQTTDQVGPVWFGPSKEVYFMGGMLNPEDLVQFIGSSQGIIYQGEQTINTALKIEDSRLRNAASALPSGVLRQTGGEPLSAQELADLAAAFNAARATNQTAALNEFLTYEPTNATPDKMLLIESANYSALDVSRLCNIPPYLLGISTGSYAYTNSRESRIDLWTFGSKSYAEVISSTLSMYLPKGTLCKFDVDDYIGEAEDMGALPSQQQPAENTQEELAS